MKRRPQAIGLCAMLGVTLLLSGCAGGAPVILAPTPAAETSLPAPETAVTAPAMTDAAPDAAVVAAESPPAQPGQQSAPAPEASTSDAVAPAEVAAPETAEAAAANLDASATAGFSQTLPAPAPQTPGDEGRVVAEAPAAEQAPQPQLARPAPPPAPADGLSQIVEGGTNGRLEVALTFDAGADTGYGPQILDFLRDEGIPATFGMTGVWAEQNPDLVQRMVTEGHQLINHTWDHSSLTGANTGLPPLTSEQVAAQLADTEAVVRNLTGYEMRPYFRPPYGDYDATSLGYLYDNGYYLSIWWTCDSHGWAGWGAQEIIDYCTTNLKEDEILLLHVGAAAAGDFEALPGLVQFFRDAGYAFVTVEQMLQP